MAYAINVPDEVVMAGKEDVYVNAALRNIQANARKGAFKRWLAEHDDAQRIYDWLNQCGEFYGYWEQKHDGGWVRIPQAHLDAVGGYPVKLDVEFRWTNHPATDGIFAGDFGQFIMGLRDSLDDWGKLSPKQTDVVRKALARKEQWIIEAAQKRAAAHEADLGSNWVGEIKERRDWELIIRNVFSFEGHFGVNYINVMEDAAGNVIIGKGTKRYGERGDAIALKATVVGHDVRDGVKQTIVNRPKFVTRNK